MKNIQVFNELQDERQFINAMSQKVIVVYLKVKWSGPERISRKIVFSIAISITIPFLVIDCSDQNKKYVNDWFMSQEKEMEHFYTNGNGEVLLIAEGKLIDYIKFPMKIGLEHTRAIFDSWQILYD